MQLVESTAFTVLYHFNIINMEKAYLKATKHYSGVLATEIQQNTARFFQTIVAPRIQPGAIKALEHHRQLGHPLVLLSTTSSFQGQEAIKSWKLDVSLTNEFPLKAGRLTGTIKRPFCYGQGKVTKAKTWAAENNIDLKKSYFYSDSFSDLPMLEAVGHPRVVNPDPKLKKTASTRSWDVLNWT